MQIGWWRRFLLWLAGIEVADEPPQEAPRHEFPTVVLEVAVRRKLSDEQLEEVHQAARRAIIDELGRMGMDRKPVIDTTPTIH